MIQSFIVIVIHLAKTCETSILPRHFKLTSAYLTWLYKKFKLKPSEKKKKNYSVLVCSNWLSLQKGRIVSTGKVVLSLFIVNNHASFSQFEDYERQSAELDNFQRRRDIYLPDKALYSVFVCYLWHDDYSFHFFSSWTWETKSKIAA